MGGHQGLPSHIGTHAAIAQDEVGQHRKDCLTRGTLNTPDGEPAQADPGIMGVAGQTPAAGAGRFMLELETKREEKGQDKLDKRFGVVKKSKVGGLIGQFQVPDDSSLKLYSSPLMVDVV